MVDYLKETYNGYDENPLNNSSFYCYTIKDIETGKYYSGSRGVKTQNTHDLLQNYFTSSTVVDFKEKLKNCPDLFEIRVEYFESRDLAFVAEVLFHNKHQVGKNPLFINSANSGGSNCGAGTVLCKHNKGTTYRVTSEEYKTGKHTHISKGLMNIRINDKIKKIKVDNFDPNIHKTEFQDYVLALDTDTNKTCRIPSDVFVSNSKYVGITKGKVAAIDTKNESTVLVSIEDFNLYPDRYVGITYGKFPVINKKTGKTEIIDKDKYDKSLHLHHNSGSSVVYCLSLRKIVRIKKEEYYKNLDNYANLSTKVFYIVDDKFFTSKKTLNVYYKKTRGKDILRVKQINISKQFTDIKTITRFEHENDKN
jgi:hypothetical protein